jgi:adiponectin receptor
MPDLDAGPNPGATPGLRQRRPSITESIVSAAQGLGAKIEQALLVVWDDLPTWRRDNHFITTGYRAESNSYWKSLKSLFYTHNESVNIWTHLLGAFIFPTIGLWLYVIIAPRYGSADGQDVLVFSCFFVGAMLCLGLSATFHSLSNHSYAVNKWGNKLDYSGIIFLIVGSYVPALYYGLYCMPTLMTVYLTGVSRIFAGLVRCTYCFKG